MSESQPGPSAAPRLSVVLGTHDRLDQVRRCIDSIRRETKTPVRIYVTDAGSTDGTIEYLQSVRGPDLEPIFVGNRIGQAKAYNDVFRIVDTPFVAWLSDDNEVVNGGLDIAVRALEADSRIGMIGLKVRDVQGPFVKAPYIGGVSKTGVLNVNQGVLPTKVMRDVGYFSEAFGFYGIDPDLTAKVLYAGHHIAYTQSVAIQHYRNWPSDPQTPEAAALKRHHDWSEQLYLAKYGDVARRDVLFTMRRAAWLAARTAMGPRFAINSHKPVLGALPRDWHNAFAARHINPLDPLFSRGKAVHLRQVAWPISRPRRLPSDESAVEIARRQAPAT
jgi:GT2 family glycosyltransferase